MIAAILFTLFVINNVFLENYTEGKITFTDKTKLPKIGKLIENIRHENATEVLRLSGELYPIWYNLTMKIYVPGFDAQISDANNLTFNANLLIKFRVEESTHRIELNALKLIFDHQNLEKYKLIRVNEVNNEIKSKPLKVIEVRIDEVNEKVFFELNGILERGEHFLFQIPYSGPISTKLSGLFLTKYTFSGEHKFAAVTHMESIDARRMIPCLDEPQFKAIYRLHIIHPSGSKAISNSKELRNGIPTDNAEWIQTDFDETPPMSSYLLALVVSDFNYIEGYTKRGIRFRVWARQDALTFTNYALESGIKVLEFYEDYFGIEFPIPKLDMVAVPDAGAGGTENWGLVTYLEKYLLYSPELCTIQQKLLVTSIIAHELAHQWFGNLVTMSWWDDLFLNEGFASLIEYLGTDAISNGKFQMRDYFIIRYLDTAFDADSKATSHPIILEIRTKDDFTKVFDSITYQKGASILRMIGAVMGEQSFKSGLKIYLNQFKYQNANHTDLWNALTEAVPKNLHDGNGQPLNVKYFAKYWTEQSGFPVVQVKRISPKKVLLTQQRFRFNSEDNNNKKHEIREDEKVNNWDIPIWWSINGTDQPMLWLKDFTELETIADDLLVLNPHSQGFYRVLYSSDQMKQISQQLFNHHKELLMASRVRIIDDSFKLAEGGYLPYEDALNLTQYLTKEVEYPPWEIALSNFNVIQNYFDDEPETEDLRAYIKLLIDDIFNRELDKIYNWKQEDGDKDFFNNLLNQRIIQEMCNLRDQRCINAILNIYQHQLVNSCNSFVANEENDNNALLYSHPKFPNKMASQCSKVPVPFRTLIYCEGVHYGTEQDWNLIFELFKNENVQVEKERLLNALTCSRDTHSLKMLLTMAIDVNNTNIRLQDKPLVFKYIGDRIIGKKIILDFFIDKWPKIYQGFKDEPFLLSKIISSSIVGKSQRVIDQVENFLRENEKTTMNLDVFKQRLEVIQTNIQWIQKNFNRLSQWFKKHNGKNGKISMFK